MRKSAWILLCVVAVAVTGVSAGLFKNSVDLADLGEVSAEKLETLRETEFAVFTAQVGLSAAKAAERRSAGAVKTADRTLEAENLDLKAAKAERKAADANLDDTRKTAASARITGAEEDLATARALKKWKSLEQEVREAEVAVAKAALDLAEAKRDLARARLLQEEAAPSADKYDLRDLENAVEKRRKEHDANARKTADKAAKHDKAKADWERLASNAPLTDPVQE